MVKIDYSKQIEMTKRIREEGIRLEDKFNAEEVNKTIKRMLDENKKAEEDFYKEPKLIIGYSKSLKYAYSSCV